MELEMRLKRLLDEQLRTIEERLLHAGTSFESPVCDWPNGAQVAHLKGEIDALRGIFDSPICDLSKDDWFALAERYGAALKATSRLLEGANALS